MDKIESLSNLKMLLDEKLISQEEYDKLKLQLLQDEESTIQEVSKIIFGKKNVKSELEENYDFQEITSQMKAKARIPKWLNIFFFVIIIGLVLFYNLYDTGVINFHKKDSGYNTNKLQTYDDLEGYVNKEADEYCEQWKKASSYQNSSRRWDEQLYVDGLINNFMLSGIRETIKSNDLPENYEKKVFELFERKMKECGWSYSRDEWPGYKKTSIGIENEEKQ